MSHVTDMIEMQNQILGEQFKGLNESFLNLVFKKSSEETLAEEFSLITKNTKELALRFMEQEESVKVISTENANIWNDLKEMQSLNAELRMQIEKLTAKAREKFRYMIDEINSLKQDKVNMGIQNDVNDKMIKGLNDDIDHMKNKLKQLRQRKFADSENSDDKLCQKCKKMYKESENFNWSCKVHVSTCVNDYWWCCGKKGESAIGCQSSKHESRDDEKEILKEEELIGGSTICSVIYKQSCRNYGHNSFNCPRDPNAKSGAESKTELERLEALKKSKNINLIGPESTQKVFDQLMNRGAIAFVSETMSCDEDSDDIIEGEENFFTDIMELKKELEFDLMDVRNT